MIRLTMIAAQSLDGFISRHDEIGTDFCSEQDSNFLSESLKEFDSMIMGRATYETLRNRISNSSKTQFLRKIVSRSPENYSGDERPELVEFTSASPSEILAELHQRNRTNCALLGGGEIYTQFLNARLIDELWLTIEPHIFGSGTKIASGQLNNQFKLNSTEFLSANTLLLKYSRA